MLQRQITYSRLVSWLKILLPVSALALLSTVFLISKPIEPTDSLTYARINLSALSGDQHILNPRFSSVTDDGSSIEFSAKSASPSDRNNVFYAKQLSAAVTTDSGARIDITAETAEIDTSANSVVLNERISVTHAPLFTLSAENLTMSLATSRISTTGPIQAQTKFGNLSAGSAQIIQKTNHSFHLLLKNGVKLIYLPEEGEKP